MLSVLEIIQRNTTNILLSKAKQHPLRTEKKWAVNLCRPGKSSQKKS